jgi:hypothetical protein
MFWTRSWWKGLPIEHLKASILAALLFSSGGVWAKPSPAAATRIQQEVDLSLVLVGWALSEGGAPGAVASPTVGTAYDLLLDFHVRDARSASRPIYVGFRGDGYGYLFDIADSLDTENHNIGSTVSVSLPVWPKVTNGSVYVDVGTEFGLQEFLELPFQPMAHRDLGRGKPYRFSEAANYKPTRDENDFIQLTDGRVDRFPEGFVGWSYAASEIVEVTIDLEEVSPISVAGVRIRGGGLHSAHFPLKTSLLVSEDGKSFRPVGTISNDMLPERKQNGIYSGLYSWLAFPVNSSARYVRLSFLRRNYIILDEIVVWGSGKAS